MQSVLIAGMKVVIGRNALCAGYGIWVAEMGDGSELHSCIGLEPILLITHVAVTTNRGW
jgi:hypothetical protein